MQDALCKESAVCAWECGRQATYMQMMKGGKKRADRGGWPNLLMKGVGVDLVSVV